MNNPFSVTKATDFSDDQILTTWVPPGDSLPEVVDFMGPMPVEILGGKGTGRTHIMRFMSWPIQELGHDTLSSAVEESGYLGLFLRCSTLNARRFAGKGVDDGLWERIFAWHLELSLLELFLEPLLEPHFALGELDEEREQELWAAIVGLLDDEPDLVGRRLADLRAWVRAERRSLDLAVNNLGLLSAELNVKIWAPPGRLVFGVPKAVSTVLGSSARFVYLLDELENFNEMQQRHVNTLVREREDPSNIIIGSRRHGVVTYMTSQGEENRRNSEFIRQDLDLWHRAHPKKYESFCEGLVSRRLRSDTGDAGEAAAMLRGMFPAQPKFDLLISRPALGLARGQGESTRVQRLFGELARQCSKGALPPEITSDRIANARTQLSCHDFPVLEEANLLLLTRAWADGADLNAAIGSIAEAAARIKDGASTDEPQWELRRHFGQDLFARARLSNRRPALYAGFEELVQMSMGLPRSLLVILKNAYSWADFESPLGSARELTVEQQRKGVLEASKWYLEDNLPSGEHHSDVRETIERFAQLLRDARYSDRLTESSPCVLSLDEGALSADAKGTLARCLRSSLLLDAEDGRDRNEETLLTRIRISPMIAPIWDLPISVRGTVDLGDDEAESVFGGSREAFDAIRRRRRLRVNAPFKVARPGEVSLFDDL